MTLQRATKRFRKELLDSFELDSELVEQFTDIFSRHAESLTSIGVAHSGSSDEPSESEQVTEHVHEPVQKRVRKRSAYNVYVREQMQTEEIKAVPHKERMRHIAGLWKNVSEEDRSGYKSKADEENSSSD